MSPITCIEYCSHSEKELDRDDGDIFDTLLRQAVAWYPTALALILLCSYNKK